MATLQEMETSINDQIKVNTEENARLEQQMHENKEKRDELEYKLDRIRALIAAQADLQLSMAPPSTKISYPVFCTADEYNLRKKNLKISDFDKCVAFSYQIKMDLGIPFSRMSCDQFKALICTTPRTDNGEILKMPTATKIYNAMKMLTENVGKTIIVAVAGSKGGGLELRRITGGYQYTEGILGNDGGTGYFHQFPTELVRKLTPQESKEVADNRKNVYAIVWETSL